MRVSEVNRLFRELTEEFFASANVVFANQSRTAKSKIPLVTIRPGNVKRPHSPSYMMLDGVSVGYYQSRISFTVDLFTHGSPVYKGDTIVAYENTALDDMLSYADFINSEHTVEWCRDKDVSILIEGDAQDLTGIVNDNNYEFRSRLTVLFYFTQKAVGSAAVWAEDSIQYPVFETVPETGEIVIEPETGKPVIKIDPVTKEPLYTTKEPVPVVDTTGDYKDVSETIRESVVIKPKPISTSVGEVKTGLVAEDTGYFNNVEIEEEITYE